MTLLPTEVLDQPTSPPLRLSASPLLPLSQQRCERNDDDVLEQTNGRTYVAGWAENSESRFLVSRSPCRRRRAARRTHDIRSVSWHGRSRRRPGISPGHCRERRWSLGVSRRRPPGSTASRRLVGCVRGDEEMLVTSFQCTMEWTGRKKKAQASSIDAVVGFFFFSHGHGLGDRCDVGWGLACCGMDAARHLERQHVQRQIVPRAGQGRDTVVASSPKMAPARSSRQCTAVHGSVPSSLPPSGGRHQTIVDLTGSDDGEASRSDRGSSLRVSSAPAGQTEITKFFKRVQ